MSLLQPNTKTPLDRIVRPIRKVFGNQSTAGIMLFVAVVVAMVWANSPWHESYHHLWESEFEIGFRAFGLKPVSLSLHHWINDGLMAIFFFVVGLEIKREIMSGELSTPKKAIMPIAAAIGGMIVPALIYFAFNSSGEAASGWGIPMATDIAFTLGVISLMGNRVPVSVKIFLTALAIVDDLGAVLVIAFFYTSDISLIHLFYGAIIMGVLLLGNTFGIRRASFYGILGIVGLWLAFFSSGVHATLAGVLLAFAIPARTRVNETLFVRKMDMLTRRFKAIDPNDNNFLREEQLHELTKMQQLIQYAETPLQQVEHALHPIVNYFIMPLFALANAGLVLEANFLAVLLHPISIGVGLGLLLGKFIGIVGFSKLMQLIGLAELPKGATWPHMYGAGMLAGIGFTMSLFISELAFKDPQMILHAKAAILVASTLAGLFGFIILRYFAEPADASQSGRSSGH